MKLDERTVVWTIGGAFLFLFASAGFVNGRWWGGILVGIGAIIGFVLDQLYKRKERKVGVKGK